MVTVGSGSCTISGDLKLDVDRSSCGGTPRRPRARPSTSVGPEELRPQAEDEVPDVADRQVEADRWPARPAAPPPPDVLDQVGHVLEGQADRVDGLDDPVVEVVADPFAFVDDRQAPDLFVKTGVLDRDPGVDGERLDER